MHYSNYLVNMNVILQPASIEDHPTMQNMGRFYVYDMTEYMQDEEGWAIPENGLYECIDLKKYWNDKNAFPFLIRINEELAGFVIIDKKGSHEKIDFNMAQFFILRKFKSKGIGRIVANECFNKFNGLWEVMVMPQNKGAYKFWKRVISEYSNNQFEEYNKNIPHLKNSEKNIFKFQSR